MKIKKREKMKNAFAILLVLSMIIVSGLGSAFASGQKDFSQNILSITISKIVDGRWVPTREVNDGEQVDVKIKYQLNPGELSSDQSSMFYQMPAGIKVVEESSGKVFDSDNRPIGTYRIGTDGRVEVSFDQSFIDSGAGIEGQISFRGMASKKDVGTSGRVDFPGNSDSITIIVPKEPEVDNSDISVKKLGNLNQSKTKIAYEIVASSDYGTKESVNLSDNVDQWNSKNIDYSYDKNSISIVKVYSNGGESPVYSNEYSITWNDKTDSQNSGFYISGLAPLGPGEKYKLRYDLNINPKEGQDAYQINNYVDVISGDANSRDQNTVKWSKDLKKSGFYDPETGYIQWSIDINPDGKDLTNWTIMDDVPGTIVGDVILRCENTGDQKVLQLNGNQIYHSFSNLSESEKTSKYTLFYYTKPDKGQSQVSNTAYLYGDGNSTDTVIVDILERKEDLVKLARGHELIDENTSKNMWDLYLTLKEGVLDGIKYQDIIHEAIDDSGQSMGLDSHYAIASELEKNFIDNLVIEIDEFRNHYRYLGNSMAQRSDNLSKDEISIVITYYDRDGRVISSDDSNQRVKKFTIEVIPKNGFELIAKKLFIGKYFTYTDVSNLKDGDRIYSKNQAIFGNLDKEAQDIYKKTSRLTKEIKVGEDYGAEKYKSGTSEIKYDSSNRRLKYRLILTTSSDDDNTDLILKDLLPKGAKIIDGSLVGRFYKDDSYLLEENYNGFIFQDGINPSLSITNIGDQEELTIKISDYKFSSEFPLIALTYEIDIEADDFWKDISNDQKSYINKATWGEVTSQTETIVKRDPIKLDKRGFQLDENDNPIYSKDGSLVPGAKPSNKIKYSVLINPKAEDLDESSENLTLTDKLVAGNLKPNLDIDSVKLYKYDPSQEGNRGSLVSDSNYKIKYDTSSNSLELLIPDKEAFVLEYVYVVDPNFVGSIKINNDVNLSGQWSASVDTVLRDVSSSASARKKVIKIYKVDEDNFKKTLPGTRFKLEFFDKNDLSWKVKFSDIEVGQGGYIQWNLLGLDKDLEADTLYRLTEVKPVAGYSAGKPTHFIWQDVHDDSNKSFENAKVAQSEVDEAGIKIFSNIGGVDYVTNKKDEIIEYVMPETGALGTKNIYMTGVFLLILGVIFGLAKKVKYK